MVSPLLLRTKSFIGNEFCEADSHKTFPVNNPATGERIADVAACGKAETERSIELARQAFQVWRALTPYERAKPLKKLLGLIHQNKSELAALLTSEQGKPIKEAEGEVVYGAAYLEWFIEESKRVYGETVPHHTGAGRILVLKEPVGVCAAITPWNFPSAMIVRKMAAALAAGCPMIVKPAPETPLSALAMAELTLQAGLPPGVFQVVTGDAEPIAKAFMESSVVRKVTFTGSTEVGKILMRQAGDTVKRLTLELGGNAPFIVFEDADLELAASHAVFGKYRNSGQTCICVNRFLVHEQVMPQFESLLVEATRKLVIGNGLDPKVTTGPLINQDAVSKVSSLIDDAVTKGASFALGETPSGSSLFVKPCVLRGIKRSMRIFSEEIFGPVSALMSFKSEEEAVQLANDTNYGLASYFFTQNLSRAVRVMEALEYGMVGVNDTTVSYPQAPFGGVKQSGFGREGSRHGIEEYLNLKYVALGV